MIKPYWESEHGRIYNCDCLEVLPELEPVDLVLTDPNYGIGEAGGKNKSRGLITIPKDYGNKRWDDKIPEKAVFDMMFMKSKYQIIFGGNFFVEYLKNSPCWIVWDKDNGNTDFADCELAWTNFDSAVRKFVYRWNGMLQESMGQFKEKRYHPTQKPVGLFMQILQKYAMPRWTILDCFAGSGTTALACERMPEMKFNWTLIEQDKDYVDICVKRIEQETRQLRLFK